jgi:undecaprenyl-diphosphatase
MNWNTHWYLDLNSISRHTNWAHGIASVYALFLGLVVLAVLLIVGWRLARRRSPRHVAAALSAGIAAVLAYLINQPLSTLIREPRPYQTLHHVLVLVPRVRDFSMPSDHAVVAGAVIAGLLIYSWRLGTLAALAGLALAFDRVYVGAHYPADALVGLGVGAAIALVLYRVIAGPFTTTLSFIARTPLRRLVVDASAQPRNPAAGAEPVP